MLTFLDFNVSVIIVLYIGSFIQRFLFYLSIFTYHKATYAAKPPLELCKIMEILHFLAKTIIKSPLLHFKGIVY